MKTLHKRFPRAQFIHIIRDGRDCALLMFNRKHDFHVYNAYFAAKYWEIYVETGRTIGNELGSNVYHELRYEDLLDGPMETMKDVCTFLNEPYDNALVNYNKSSEAGKTPLLQKPIQKTNKEKWRTDMTKQQIKTFESAVGNTLRQCSYKLCTDASPLPLYIKAFWRIHNTILDKYHLAMKSRKN